MPVRLFRYNLSSDYFQKTGVIPDLFLTESKAVSVATTVPVEFIDQIGEANSRCTSSVFEGFNR